MYPDSVNIISLKDLLLRDYLDIIVVEAGDFKFTLALAALRGSWKGITSTPWTFAYKMEGK